MKVSHYRATTEENSNHEFLELYELLKNAKENKYFRF